MVDQLPTIGGDSGAQEAIPVVIFKSAQNGGGEVDFSGLGGGGGGAGTEYVEDAASAANPSGGMLIARRRDTLVAGEVSTDGDNIALNATAKGELVTRDGDAVTQLVAILAAAIAATPAGEAHIGKIGGETLVVAVAPTVSTSPAYTSGDVIGTKMTFAGFGRVSGGTGLAQMVSIYSKSAQTFACDLLLFHTDPSNTTFTDNAALALNGADYDKLIDVVHITDWTNLGVPSFGKANGLAIPYKVASGATDIYGVLVARATPTLASTSDLKVVVKGLLD